MTESNVIVLDEYSSGNIVALPYGTITKTPEQQKAQKNHKEKENLRKVDERGAFVILNLEYLQEKLKDVTYFELGYAMMLLPHISYFEKGETFTRVGTEANSFTYEKIGGIWGLKPDTVRKMVKILEDNRILTSTPDKLDMRKKVVHFSKRLVVKGGNSKHYKMYTKVYQMQLLNFIDAVLDKSDVAKAVGLFTSLLIKLNGHTQLLIEDDEKASSPLRSEQIEDFFSRFRIGSKNATSISTLKKLVGVTDNRSIKKSLVLLQKEGVINQISIDKKKAFVINPTFASKQDSSKYELYGFTLKYFFQDATVSKLMLYQIPALEERDGR